MFWDNDAELLTAFGEPSSDAEMSKMIERGIGSVDEDFIIRNIAERQIDRQTDYEAMSNKTLKLIARSNARCADLAVVFYERAEDADGKLRVAVFIESFTRRFCLAKNAMEKRISEALPEWMGFNFCATISAWLLEVEKDGQEERNCQDGEFLKGMGIVW